METFRAKAAALVVCLVAIGCSGPSRPCSSDADCGGARCDTELGACVNGTGGGGGNGCEPACGALEECSGTTCANRYESITIVAPTANEGAAAISAIAELNVATGRTRNDPATLDYRVKTAAGAQVSTGTMTLVAGTKGRYTATLGALQTNSYVFEVSAPNGPTASRPFAVDTTPPTLWVEIPNRIPEAATATTNYTDPDTAYANAWRRDQTVSVVVKSNEALVRATVELFGSPDAKVPFNADAPGVTPCDAGFCGAAQLKLWAVPMNAFRTVLPIRASGVDKSGNQSSVADAGVKVTRWRWEFDAGVGAVASPAIGPRGTVIVSAAGTLSALTPSGDVLWQANLGSSSGAPSIGGGDGGAGLVYVGASSGNGYVHALSVADGGTESRCPSAGGTGTPPHTLAIGRGDLGNGVAETAMGAFSGSGRIVFLQPDVGSSPCGAVTTNVSAATASGSAITSSGAILYPTDNQEIASYSPGGLQQVSGFPVGLNSNADFLAAHGGQVIGSRYGSLSSGALFTIPDGGAARDGLTDAGRLDGFVIDSGGRVIAASRKTMELLVVDPTLTNVIARADAGTSAFLALGAGGLLYSASTGTAEIGAWRNSDVSRLWSISLGSNTHNAPAIDCPRSLSGTVLADLPGVLYVPGTDGKLRALIVDSRGIDTAAKWPKWQRDPRNSGNADINLSQFACDP